MQLYYRGSPQLYYRGLGHTLISPAFSLTAAVIIVALALTLMIALNRMRARAHN